MSKAQLFISYSHKDEDWLELVQTHLAILRMQGNITAWSDRDIQPGDHWNQEIETAMQEADVGVLLVSPNFFASDFIMRKELPRLMAILKREQPGRLRRILPLILEPCLWKSVPELNELEVRPKSHALSAGNEHERHADLADFAQQVSKLLFEAPKPVETFMPHPGPPGREVTFLGARDYATLEIRLSHREWNRYQVKLSFTWSGDRKWDFVRRYETCLDLDAFAAIEDAENYARELRSALFPDEAAWSAVTLAKARVEEKPDVTLRVRLCIEPSARELHSLNWEKLTVCGDPDNPLAYRTTAFARYALGYGGSARAAFIRRRATPTALLLGATAELAYDGDSDEALNSLDAVKHLLSGAGIACTLNKRWYELAELKETLREHDGIDYLCLLMRTCRPTGGDAPLCGNRVGVYRTMDQARRSIAEALDAMERPPRLVVITPTGSGASVSPDCWPWLLHLSHEVVECGVLGVLTLQAALDQESWHDFLAEFFGQLISHGQTDLAARAARMKIVEASTRWAPVVASRMRSARVWYEPHLMNETHRGQTWDLLIARIRENRCMPIIGPGVDYRIARFRQEIALKWAERYQYPFAMLEQVNLPQVAQYIAATHGDAQMEKDFTEDLHKFVLNRYGHLLDDDERRHPLSKLLELIGEKVFLDEPWDPHVILATLPFYTYVTANFNNFLADALRRSKRPPQELIFNRDLTTAETAVPRFEQPLVYHLFGRLDDIESLVLTEDDYFDFLIDFWRERERIPTAIRRALGGASLLFLGFNLNNWDFRVLFRSLLKEQSSQRRRKQFHVAVQVDPDDDQITNPDRAREYLERYFEGFSESDISIYWGSSEDFLEELKNRLGDHR